MRLINKQDGGYVGGFTFAGKSFDSVRVWVRVCFKVGFSNVLKELGNYSRRLFLCPPQN